MKNSGWGGGSQTHNGHEGSSNRDIADMKGKE